MECDCDGETRPSLGEQSIAQVGHKNRNRSRKKRSIQMESCCACNRFSDSKVALKGALEAKEEEIIDDSELKEAGSMSGSYEEDYEEAEESSEEDYSEMIFRTHRSLNLNKTNVEKLLEDLEEEDGGGWKEQQWNLENEDVVMMLKQQWNLENE